MANAGNSFKSFGTLLVLAFVTFSVLIKFSFTHQNSIFAMFQEFNVGIKGTQNTTKQGMQNIVPVQVGGEKNPNIRESVAGKSTL